MGNINAMIAIVNTHPINAWLRLGLRIDSNVRIRCEMQSQIIPGKPKISVNFSFWPICFCLWLVFSCYFVFKRFSFYYLIPKSSVWNLIRTFVLWSKFATVTHTKKTQILSCAQRQKLCINFILHTYAYCSFIYTLSCIKLLITFIQCLCVFFLLFSRTTFSQFSHFCAKAVPGLSIFQQYFTLTP